MRAENDQRPVVFFEIPSTQYCDSPVYAHLTIALRQGYDQMYSAAELARLTWQATKSKPDSWYGFHIETRHNYLDTLADAVRVLRRIERKAGRFGMFMTPETVVEALHGLRIRQRVYDARLSTHVAVDEIPTSEMRAYVDATKDHCTVRVLASREAEAIPLIAAELATYSMPALAAWVQAGSPVREVDVYAPALGYDDALGCWRPTPFFSVVRESAEAVAS